MQGLLEKLTLAVLLIVIILLGYFLFLKQNHQNKNDEIFNSKILSEVQNKKAELINKGIDWFIKNKDLVDPNDIAVHFIYFYKTTNDSSLVEKLSKIAKEKSSDIKIIDTKFDENNSKYLDWENLKYIYFSLERKKCKNQDYQKDLDFFKQYFNKNNAKIVPEEMDISRKLIIYYQLQELGVVDENAYNKTIEELNKVSLNPNSKNYVRDLYAFTHVIFIASNYYSKYLDPKDYQKQIGIFNEAMKYFEKKDLDDNSLNISSEIIISMKLLKQTQSKDFENLSQKILSYQNADGSFGTGDKKDPSVKIHSSAVALLAIMDFTQNLREAKNYCFY